MYFDDISSFFDMGGYGLFVWLSFGSGFLCVLLLWADSFFSKKTLLTQVLSEQARQVRIKAAAKSSNNGETI
jgi:heme exporter protein D